MHALSCRIVFLVLALLASGAGFTARAAEPVVTNPSWLRKPTGENVANYFPREALDRSISGRAVLSCLVRADTHVESCEVISEAPYGMGFGRAAARLMVNAARFKPGMIDGKPTSDGRIQVPVQFAAPLDSARFVLTDPIWIAAPSFEDMAAAWPATGAPASPVTVVLRCSLLKSGHLTKCGVAADSSGGVMLERARALSQTLFKVRLTPEEAETYVRSDVLVSQTFIDPTSPEGRSGMVRAPRWIVAPDRNRIQSVYPALAAEAGITAGRGTADCLVAPDGKLTDCKVGRESPAAMGFGASALAIAGLMQMNPWSTDGRPVAGARIRLPIDFNLSPEDDAGAED